MLLGFSAFMTSTKESYSNGEQNYPLNLPELFRDSVNPESNYHYLGLLSLNTVIWNLNIYVYLIELLDFQVLIKYTLKKYLNFLYIFFITHVF